MNILKLFSKKENKLFEKDNKTPVSAKAAKALDSVLYFLLDQQTPVGKNEVMNHFKNIGFPISDTEFYKMMNTFKSMNLIA